MNISEENMTLINFVFPKLQTPKTWFDKCLKSPLSKEPSTSNMGNWPEYSWNLNRSKIIRFIDHCQGNCVGKSFSNWQAESWDWLLTYMLLMTSILLLIEKINGTNWDPITSKTKNFFWPSFWIFQIYIKFSSFRKKQWLS